MTKSNIHIMLDLETTALSPNAGIVQIGAYAFSDLHPQANKYFNVRCSPTYNESHGYEVDPATMKWWETQDPAVRHYVFSGAYSIKEQLAGLVDYATAISSGHPENIYLWANHIDFDLVILKNAFYKEHSFYPFDFRKHMDYATLKNLLPQYTIERDKKEYPAHDALADAIFQGKHCSVLLQELQANGLLANAFYTIPA